ncbi:polymorphic toxin type 15 domain-containing protein [Scopulibacillus cellulosilyticus]|uniref:Polymorphic toxin type 15 domain-containing protein n=1 Tax=Scopulibacillus cellulosilyticus TaxID=2665665 RepID=A0ABW2Q0D8_9BACL
MGQIKVEPDRLEQLADKLGDAKSSCGDALSALKWHFTSLIAEVTDIEGGYASSLHQQLINHIEHYQDLLDQSQAIVKRTAAQFRQADESALGHIWDTVAEVLPIHDFQRLFGEYDPVTGEKLGFGDRLLAFGMVASSFFPPARGAGLLVKTGIKGVKMIKMSEEGAKLFKGVKNVLHPNLIKNAFRNTFQAVKHQSLGLTNQIVKKVGNIRLPQVLQPEFAGIGKVETTVGDVFKSAKDTMMKAVGREGGGGATARRVEEGSSNSAIRSSSFVGKVDGVSRLDKIEVKFKRNPKHDPEEFARQLKAQEEGMNKLTVDQYLSNRERYLEKGRAPEGNAAQQAAREEALAQKVHELQQKGLSLKEAKKKASEWIKTQAALHNPDQIAGGNPLDIGGLGDKAINSSIGSQWKHKIGEVDQMISNLRKGMTEEQQKNIYLNVKLKH